MKNSTLPQWNPHFLLLFRSYAWSQKDPQMVIQLWYRISQGFILKNKLRWEIWSYTAFRFFFFLPRLLFGALSNASQQDFWRRMLRILTMISCEDMLHPAKSSKPISTLKACTCRFFLNEPPWSIKQNEKNLLSMTTPSHLTSWWWDPSKGSASCNALLDQALIKKPQGIKKSLRFHATQHVGFCLSFLFDLMNFDFGLHFGFDFGSCFATTIFVNVTVTMSL